MQPALHPVVDAMGYDDILDRIEGVSPECVPGLVDKTVCADAAFCRRPGRATQVPDHARSGHGDHDRIDGVMPVIIAAL